jgi:predicted transglutaminase-like cysteine proteinase
MVEGAVAIDILRRPRCHVEVTSHRDDWASPLETPRNSAGDCEDLAIAKYFTPVALGILDAKMRLVYANAMIGGPGSTARACGGVVQQPPLRR